MPRESVALKSFVVVVVKCCWGEQCDAPAPSLPSRPPALPAGALTPVPAALPYPSSKNRMDALTGLNDVSDSDDSSSSSSGSEAEEESKQPAKKARKQEIDLETLQVRGSLNSPFVNLAPE